MQSPPQWHVHVTLFTLPVIFISHWFHILQYDLLILYWDEQVRKWSLRILRNFTTLNNGRMRATIWFPSLPVLFPLHHITSSLQKIISFTKGRDEDFFFTSMRYLWSGSEKQHYWSHTEAVGDKLNIFCH